jgi:hypothetical protein
MRRIRTHKSRRIAYKLISAVDFLILSNRRKISFMSGYQDLNLEFMGISRAG